MAAIGTPGDLLQIQFSVLRYYLSNSQPGSGLMLIRDALVHGEPGALQIVELVRGSRVNRRTRRTLAAVKLQLLNRGLRASWFLRLCHSVFALWNTLRRQARPRSISTVPSLVDKSYPESQQRRLARAGVLVRDRRTLREQASVAAQDLLNAIQGKQCLVWLDNWYWERYTQDPAHPNLSHNVTALAVLPLCGMPGSNLTTRQSSLPDFRGHLQPSLVVNMLPQVATQMADSLSLLLASVTRLGTASIPVQHVRVPLDVMRTRVRSLGWRPLCLSPLSVGFNDDLLQLMNLVKDFQVESEHVLPLLVDENIHYRLVKLMYGKTYSQWDVASWLKKIPLLYGIWHPYKHTLLVLYRAFLPILAQLESCGEPVVGRAFRSHRKVLYLEKLFATLLVSGGDVRSLLESQIHHHLGLWRTAKRSEPGTPMPLKLKLLRALKDLLFYWVPAVFSLGVKVRECAWEGRPGGTATGAIARRVLQHAILLQCQLRRAWDARDEYCRTMSVALLLWQPWMTALPGCCFVEEAGEALLSRVASRVKSNTGVKTFSGAYQLFLTLKKDHVCLGSLCNS